MKYISLFSFILLTSSLTSLNAETFKSSTSQTSLLELYSSQGCSSCPPAERWVSNLLQNNKLWSDFIPVVYHVDYWNYLGWKDPFSDKAFSHRQRTYHKQNAVSSVYTPGFILNGEEWRTWFLRRSVPTSNQQVNVLQVSLNKNELTATYDSSSQLILNAALLGFGIETDVKSGENLGRSFSENFIVLNQSSISSNNGKWRLNIPSPGVGKAKRYAIAVWLNAPDKLAPIQATGGWISKNNFN